MNNKKIIIVFLIILGVLILGTGYIALIKVKNITEKSTSKEQLVSEAYNLVNAGDFENAKNVLEQAIKDNPSYDLQITLASLYLNEGVAKEIQQESSEKAQAILFELEKNNKNIQVYNLLGNSYKIIGENDRALEYYNKSLAMKEKSSDTLFSMGSVYYAKGENEDALGYYTKAEENITDKTDNTTKAKIYAGLGNLSKDYEKAEEYFLKSIENSHSKLLTSESYANLAMVKLLQKDNEKAFDYANKALEEYPSNEIAHLAFVKSSFSEKKFLETNSDKIKESLFKAMVLSPKKAEPPYWQGKFDFINGNMDLALRSFETALGLVSRDTSLTENSKNSLRADINLDMAVVYFLKKDNKSAELYIQDALRYNPVEIMYILQNTTQLKELYDMVNVQ